MSKVEVVTNAVSWSNGKVLMYQTSFKCEVNKERSICILGDPKSTRKQAVESAKKEVELWGEVIKAFEEKIAESENEQNTKK